MEFNLDYKAWSIAFEISDPEIQKEMILSLVKEEAKKVFETSRIQYKDSSKFIYETFEDYEKDPEGLDYKIDVENYNPDPEYKYEIHLNSDEFIRMDCWIPIHNDQLKGRDIEFHLKSGLLRPIK